MEQNGTKIGKTSMFMFLSQEMHSLIAVFDFKLLLSLLLLLLLLKNISSPLTKTKFSHKFSGRGLNMKNLPINTIIAKNNQKQHESQRF